MARASTGAGAAARNEPLRAAATSVCWPAWLLLAAALLTACWRRRRRRPRGGHGHYATGCLPRRSEDAARHLPADPRRRARPRARPRHRHAHRAAPGQVPLGLHPLRWRARRHGAAGRRRRPRRPTARSAHGGRRQQPLVLRPGPAAGHGEAGRQRTVGDPGHAAVGRGGSCSAQLRHHAPPAQRMGLDWVPAASRKHAETDFSCVRLGFRKRRAARACSSRTSSTRSRQLIFTQHRAQCARWRRT